MWRSLVITQRAGRRPLRSRVQAAWRPSVSTIPAGPSHGSACMEWYS